jgi:putative membrane protein
MIFIKGIAMGTANVIPGVSGGTIALITGIFERLINALKSFDLYAIKALFKGNFREFARHVDLTFLIALFLGVGIAIISFARIFEVLFRDYPVYIWSFFIGLVLASVYFVGKTVKKWHAGSVSTFIIGTATAIFISITTPGSENDNLFYLLLCGVVAICSMILPGLSGSFVLLLMGNYQLVMIDAINNRRFDVLIPIAIGAVAGLLAFSHFLSWVLKRFPDSTIAILTGFILGSLGILWPWKTSIIETFGDKVKTIGYEWHLPEINSEFAIAIICFISGILIIYLTETLAKKIVISG